MKRRHLYALVGTIALFVSLSGVAAAAPGDGPPGDTPSPGPDLVTGGLGGVGDFVGELVQDVFAFVDGLTPDAAGDGIDTARGAVFG